ncbi:MAG: prepilin peptidase, partial [Pseudomonadota bacterium]
MFVDEARTPLIIASDTHDAEHTALVQLALEVASTLREDEHFTVDRGRRRVSLEAEGREAIAAVDADVPLFRVALYREELLTQALAALHLFRRDEQYLVRDGEVQIIDENTGRVMPGRSWTRGLHQMVEAKEKCAISPARDTLAQISYQRFFRRYRRLSGMSGTASEVRDEMWRVYRTPVVRIAPRVDSQRVRLPDRVLPTEAEKWASVTAQVLAMSGQGRPVLVGTRTVRASEALSANLTDAGISHELLNARQDADEAATVARAGQVGAVTVATNMAGRGTDIRLGEGVAARGGLHVIATERHEAGRIDRQLIGRCGRQGDPGSFEFILSLEDALVDSDRSGWRLRLRRALQRILGGGAVFAGPGAALAGALLASAQRRVQKTHSRLRRELVRSDRDEAKQLAFSGK